MRKKTSTKALVAVLFLGSISLLAVNADAQQSAAPPETFSPAVQEHVTAANLLAQQDIRVNKYTCPPGDTPEPQDKAVAPPTKIFDQLYFFGMDSVTSFALVTSAGIIQFDSLDNTEEAQRIIIGGYKAVGLDPTQMKYLIISHGHADHYGGAKYLQDTYHPHVLMGPGDWDMLARQSAARAASGKPETVPPPTRDVDVVDGQKLTLGNETITLYRTPGHTPDTISALIPVTDNGKPHMLSWTGGSAPPGNIAPSQVNGGLAEMQKAYERWTQIGVDAGVDAYISPHPRYDSSFAPYDKENSKIEMLRARKPGDPNPFVSGQDKYLRYMVAHLECIEAKEIWLNEKGKN